MQRSFLQVSLTNFTIASGSESLVTFDDVLPEEVDCVVIEIFCEENGLRRSGKKQEVSLFYAWAMCDGGVPVPEYAQ